jgi:hypothetical protein
MGQGRAKAKRRWAAQTPLRGEGLIFIFLREAKFQQPVCTARLSLT